MKHLTCGCCTMGCVCYIHEDLPNGKVPRLCNYCARLPYAPLDKSYRYDSQSGEFVRKSQGMRDYDKG